jgi:glycine cleavage system H protein
MADSFKFTHNHLWVRVTDTQNHTARIGLSDYIQEELGEIIGVELPDIGDEIEKDESFGEVESVQTVSELFAPVSGTVTAVNDELEDQIGLINEDPYHDGWLIAVELSDPDELDDLIEREEYQEFAGQAEQDEAGEQDQDAEDAEVEEIPLTEEP